MIINLYGYCLVDNLGLHRVENISHSEGAVSLHLYCPPYDACSIFHQKTGKETKCKVEFYSKFGQRRHKVNATFQTFKSIHFIKCLYLID